MEELKEFAKRLKEIRTELKFSQREFAEKVGITAATLSAYELNQKNPSFTSIVKIADVCNVSIDWLCGKTDKRIYNSINTYSDVFQMFIEIDDFMRGKLGWCKVYATEEYFPDAFGNVSEMIEKSVFLIEGNDTFTKLFKEWEKIRELYLNSTIDRELYDAWIEKKKREYDLNIDELPIPSSDNLPFW